MEAKSKTALLRLANRLFPKEWSGGLKGKRRDYQQAMGIAIGPETVKWGRRATMGALTNALHRAKMKGKDVPKGPWTALWRARIHRPTKVFLWSMMRRRLQLGRRFTDGSQR